MRNIELIVTVRCKVCGEIISVNAELESDNGKDNAKSSISKFAEDHRHTPWIV